MSVAEEGFVRAIGAEPDDDTHRLVYADWLEDHGQSERAEFIRVQIDLARTDPTDQRLPELHLRQLQLLSEHEREWLGPWADRLVRWRFQRGMLHEVTVEPEPFIAFGADLLARHPVHTVAFVNDEGESLEPGAIKRVLAVPHLTLVRGLELSGCRPNEEMFGMFGGHVHTSDWLEALAGASHATRLEAVALPGGTRMGRGRIEPRALAAFCAAPHLASLRRLDLCDLYENDGPDRTPALCEILAGATFAPNLRRLSLARCVLTDDALGRLTSSAGLRNLEAVDLRECDAVGADGLRDFLASRPPRRLTDLGLPYGLPLGELGAWPGLEAIQKLRLSGRTRRGGEEAIHYQDGRVVRWTSGRDVGEGEWIELFRAPHLRPTSLEVAAEAMPEDALAVLFGQDWIEGLRTVDLSTSPWDRLPQNNALGLLLERDTPRLHEVGLPVPATLSKRRLAAWPVLPRLTRFSFGREEGLAAWLLSRAPLTARVPRLHLDDQRGGEPLVRALATSPWARGVCHLDFGYNDLTPTHVTRLASAPFASHLEALHLGSEWGEETLDAFKVLADDRNFPRLRDVVVGSGTVEGGIEVLRRRFESRLRVWADC